MEVSIIRNFGIAAHIDAGKTTVSEHMLYLSGMERRIGQVDDGTAVLDWMAEERERGITITSAATTIPWEGYSLNLIDTPGHVDFTMEVERCMRVLDGAVLVIDAVMGVQAQSEAVWRQMQRHQLPAIAFVNKCDKAGADYLKAVSSIKSRLQAPAIAVQFPVFRNGEICQIVDLINRTAWRFDRPHDLLAAPYRPHHGGLPCPKEVLEDVDVLHAELVDVLAEEDDDVLQRVVDEREPEEELLRSAMRRRVLSRTLLPVLCGAALRNVGIEPLLRAVVDLLPSPLDVPPVAGCDPKTGANRYRSADLQSPFAALAFKTQSTPHGDLTFIRIYSGTLAQGTVLFNSRKRESERATRILRMHAESGVSINEAGAGDIVALLGMKNTGTGDTLCSIEDQILLEPILPPAPVITHAVEPENAGERLRLRLAMERLTRDDPSLQVKEHEDLGQWLVSGMGELHLEVMQHRLQSEFKLNPRFGKPRVSYREAIAKTVRGRGVIDRVVGGRASFAIVELALEPSLESEVPAIEFRLSISPPSTVREAVVEALLLEAQVGPRFGYPMVGVSICVDFMEVREGPESEGAVVQAAVQALRHAMREAQVVIEEPVMCIEIYVPAEFLSGIMADLNSRHANVQEVMAEGSQRRLRGDVPLSAMFGYSTTIRSLSQGRGSFTMFPTGYRSVPETELVRRGLSLR